MEPISSNHFEGWHILLELRGVPSATLNDRSTLEHALVESATKAGATVVQSVFHNFNPQGLSGVVVIAESHVAVHTWPEYGHASVDIFTCGDNEVAERIVEEVIARFSPCEWDRTTVRRGSSFGVVGDPVALGTTFS